jgi:HEAT repeat protein
VLYSSDIVAESIVPLFLALLQDPVVAVRKPLVRCLGKITQSLESNSDKRKSFLDQLKALAKETHYQWRQLFAQLCFYGAEQLEKAVFEEEFLPLLIELASDKVPNTRFTAAKALRRMADLGTFSFTSSLCQESTPCVVLRF